MMTWAYTAIVFILVVVAAVATDDLQSVEVGDNGAVSPVDTLPAPESFHHDEVIAKHREDLTKGDGLRENLV